jgi:hypothetical protein
VLSPTHAQAEIRQEHLDRGDRGSALGAVQRLQPLSSWLTTLVILKELNRPCHRRSSLSSSAATDGELAILARRHWHGEAPDDLPHPGGVANVLRPFDWPDDPLSTGVPAT